MLSTNDVHLGEKEATTGRIPWRIGAYEGYVLPGYGDSWVGESEHVLSLGAKDMERGLVAEAALAVYHKEIVVGPVLESILAKYRIEHPDAPAAAYAVMGNGDFGGNLSSDQPRPAARPGPFVNLSPWERAAVQAARANRSATISLSVIDGDITQFYVSAGRVLMSTSRAVGDGTRQRTRWQIVDGCRRFFID